MRTDALDRWKEKYPDLFAENEQALMELFELFMMDSSNAIADALNDFVESNIRLRDEELETELAQKVDRENSSETMED